MSICDYSEQIGYQRDIERKQQYVAELKHLLGVEVFVEGEEEQFITQVYPDRVKVVTNRNNVYRIHDLSYVDHGGIEMTYHEFTKKYWKD